MKIDEDNEPTQTTEIQKDLFIYWVGNSEASEYIFNLYTHPPSCYSSSRNCQLSLPRPSIDIF